MRKNQYSSDKRRKELDRKKKQEEKRARRLNKGSTDPDQPQTEGEGDTEGVVDGEAQAETTES